MAKTTAQDKTLGTLYWDPFDHMWGAAVPFDYFREFGSGLREYEDEEDEGDEIPEDQVEKLELPEGVDDPILGAVADMMSGKRDFMSALEAAGGQQFKEMMNELKPEEKSLFSQAMSNLRELGEDVKGDDPLLPEDLFKKGQFKLTIAATAKKKPPAASAAAKWKKLVEDKDLWKEIVDLAVKKYRDQRPARLHWWKATYGEDDRELPAALPEVKSARELSRIIRPVEFRMHTNGDVGVHFDSYWNRCDGFGVRLRDGKIHSIGDKEVALTSPSAKPRKRIDHPVFGELQYAGIEWVGRFRWEPFREFLNVVEDRMSFRRMKMTEMPRSSPKWRFIEGEFPLNIHAFDESNEPTDAHAKTFSQFMADPERSARQILEAILEYYRKNWDAYHKYLKGENEELMPKGTSMDVLRERITLQGMLILPPGKEGEPIALGFSFDSSWEQEHGLGVRWRDGKVEEVGYADVSFTQ
jgi:hypothetical protein